MMKKLIAALLLLAFVLPGTALADAQVIDDASLFTISEIAAITEVIENIELEHQVDIVVLTTNDTPYDPSESLHRVRDYADDYYDNHGYGMGPDNSGLLFMIDMNNRVMWISTAGVMTEYINDAREEEILDAASPNMSRGNYGQATLRAMQTVAQQMDDGREKGSFLYDEVTGKRLSGIYNPFTGGELALSLGAGVVAALIMWFSVGSRYNLKGSTYSYDTAKNMSVDMTKDSEHFLRKTVSRTARASSYDSPGGGRSSGGRSSGGSGVHTSSSGSSHGGGGRRF